MEEKGNLLESLLDSAKDYGLTSLELIRLKTIDKTVDVISSLIPSVIFGVLVLLFCLFLSLGLAFWLGDLLGKIYYGFFAVAGLYLLLGLIIHFMLRDWIKKIVGDICVKNMLK